MRHVKLFEAFSTPTLTEEQISWLDECATGVWSLNPSTGLVDVDGDFYCGEQGLKDFKGVAFGHVKGDFSCDNNQLTSLEGAPQTVKGDFYCYSNQLTSLEGAPQTVGGDFDCGNNQLTSLDGAPQTVDRGFFCDSNQLTSLVGAPKTVNGGFRCADNPLKSLVGAPESVGSFEISMWDSDPGIRALDWEKGWDKKEDKVFTKTLTSKLKEINALGSDANKGKSVSMLLSLAGQHFDLLEYLLSLRLSTSDKFEVYGAIKANMPDVWNKIKDEVDPEGDTSDLMDLGF